MSKPTETLPLTQTLAPVDQAAVAEAIRDASETDTPIYPSGGRTGLGYGVTPVEPGVGLSLEKLDRVVDYPADDMTITVEAGIRVSQLARTLAKHRQWLPIDIPNADRATIGGALATNTSGPRRYACGTLRDYLLGLTAVDGLGESFVAGGRVVKNAAGYNLPRLLVGSLGTLGVITQVTLMVRPLPEMSVLMSCELSDLDAAEHVLAAMVHTKTLPVTVELQAGRESDDDSPLGTMGESSVARLIVGFEGGLTEVEWMVQTLQSEWRELDVNASATVPAALTERLWKWLAERSADIEIGVRPGATVEMIDRLLTMAPDCSILARAGNGVIRATLPSREPAEYAAMVREQLRPMVAEAGGRLTVLSQPEGADLSADDIWGLDGHAREVMDALKERFDPKRILNRGRYVFEER